MKSLKKISALALASALVVSGLTVAQSAQAAEMTPAGTITLTPSSGNDSDTYFLTAIAVNRPAPAGFQAASSTLIYQGGVEMGAISNTRFPDMPSTAGVNGLNGTSNPSMNRSIITTNNFVSSKKLNTITIPLSTGPFELRYYYFADFANPDPTTDPYVKIDLTYNATTGAWSAPIVATPTTTSLTASAAGTTVTLNATVKKASDGTTATAAAGSIAFKEGATTVATVPVASGAATTVLNAVANGAHTYTAVFTPSDAVYSASTSSAASVNVGSIPAPTGPVPVNITFQVAAGAGGGILQLTSSSSSVDLGAATLGNGTLNASGTLNAVVDDARQADAPAWSLTGQMGDFTVANTTKTLSGKYLGWTPAVTAGSVGFASPAVLPAPGSPDGLKTTKPLAYGSPSAADPQLTTTTVSALLQLKAPTNTASGNYAGTLTLTLI